MAATGREETELELRMRAGARERTRKPQWERRSWGTRLSALSQGLTSPLLPGDSLPVSASLEVLGAILFEESGISLCFVRARHFSKHFTYIMH